MLGIFIAVEQRTGSKRGRRQARREGMKANLRAVTAHVRRRRQPRELSQC